MLGSFPFLTERMGHLTTLEEVRKYALSLPEVTEEPHFEKTSFRVRGKIFATVPEGGQYLHVFTDELEVRSCVEDDPEAYEVLMWGRRVAGVRINLAASKLDHVLNLLEDGWRRMLST